MIIGSRQKIPGCFEFIDREKYIVEVEAVEFEDWCCCNKYFGEITLKPYELLRTKAFGKYFTLNISILLAFIVNDH